MSQDLASPRDLQPSSVRPEIVSAAIVVSLTSKNGNTTKLACVDDLIATTHCGKRKLGVSEGGPCQTSRSR